MQTFYPSKCLSFHCFDNVCGRHIKNVNDFPLHLWPLVPCLKGHCQSQGHLGALTLSAMVLEFYIVHLGWWMVAHLDLASATPAVFTSVHPHCPSSSSAMEQGLQWHPELLPLAFCFRASVPCLCPPSQVGGCHLLRGTSPHSSEKSR